MTGQARTLQVAATGAQLTIQDQGRPGHGSLGVSPGGAFDRGALRLANRLVGNPESAAGLEVLMGGARLRAGTPLTVAVTGAPLSVTVDGRSAALGAAVRLPADAELALGRPTGGMRSYLAVAGGLLGEAVFGSLSSDLTGGVGPAELQPGDELQVGSPVAAPPAADTVALWSGPDDGVHRLAFHWGPRDDWFTDEARRLFTGTDWQVGSELDRSGVRLEGPTLPRSRTAELASEGVTRGSVQVPSAGVPLVFGADHPATGGYPVIGVVTSADLDRLAQVRPGDRLRFRPIALG